MNFVEAELRCPKLLFLARAFPPLRVTACVRTWNIAKYLARLGWCVTVVTPHPSIWRDVDNPEETDKDIEREGIRRILTDHKRRYLAPNYLNCWNRGLGWVVGGIFRKLAEHTGADDGLGWIKAAEHQCAGLTAKDADVILTTGAPFAAFNLARSLSKRLGCPYVLDYRDPWTGNPHVLQSVRPVTLREEERLLSECSAVTVVSKSWGLAMDRQFNLRDKLHVLTNGYDPEELANVKPNDFGHFAIVYAGTFYPPKRSISPVMAALKRLRQTINGKGVWYFHYYGGHESHIREEAERFALMDRVVLHGNVPRAEALSAIRGAGVAVVITSLAEKITMGDQGIVPGKLFESLGLGTATLVIAPAGSDIEAVLETTGLARRFAGNDVDGIVSFLENAFSGDVPGPRDPEYYAWKNIAKQLDYILRAAMQRVSDNFVGVRREA